MFKAIYIVYSRLLPILIISGFMGAESAEACIQQLKNSRTSHLPTGTSLCELQDRYQTALEKLESQGVSPAHRIANLHAPRMINYPTWVKKRASKNYSPWFIYEPAPQTWQSWEDGARVVDALAEENRSSASIRPMNFKILTKLHGTSLRGLLSSAGEFRTHPEIGKSISRQYAVKLSEATNLMKSEYQSILYPKEPMMEWHPTECYEDRPLSFQRYFAEKLRITGYFDSADWPDQDPGISFVDTDGTVKQCGYIQYPSHREVPRQMSKWLNDMNRSIRALNGPLASTVDLLEAASRAQRWFVSIHPFDDGNGRLSRFMMEYLLRSVGLPSPLLSNFNDDMYKTEKQWADEIGAGLIRAVETAESCAANPWVNECQAVPETPK